MPHAACRGNVLLLSDSAYAIAIITMGIVIVSSIVIVLFVFDAHMKTLGGFGDDMAASENDMPMPWNHNDWQSEASGLGHGMPVAIYDLRGASIISDGNTILVLDGQRWSQYGNNIPLYAEGSGTLTRIFNADTLAIDGEKFQLSLTNAPEGKQRGAVRAMALVEAVCRVGSTVYYDIDDLQPEDRYGRHLALVWCGDMQKPLNQVLLETGHAKVLRKYCGESEFGDLLCTGMPMPWNVMVTKGDCDQKPNTLPCQQNMTR